MKLVALMLANMVRWTLSPTDPAVFPAIADLGVSLVNPYAAPDAEQLTGFRLPTGGIHVMPKVLWLLVPSDPPPEIELSQWLRLLRLVSKQASFPLDAMGMGHGIDVKEADLAVKLPTEFAPGQLFGAYRVETAIDAVAIARARELKSPDAIPLYHELLLDAIQAVEQRRHREAILFSAIAVESLAKHELTAAHQAAINAAAPPPHLNVLQFHEAGGKVTRKDPIFQALTEGDNFSKLVHEAPLYVLRRSLLNEDQALYQRARELYGTRNRLGHGQPITPQDHHLLVVDQEGAMTAVETAIEVFDWFGQPGHKVPRHGVVVEVAAAV